MFENTVSYKTNDSILLILNSTNEIEEPFDSLGDLNIWSKTTNRQKQ